MNYRGDEMHQDTKIPYGKQHIDQDDIDAVIKVLQSDFLTTGPTVEVFEKAFAEKVEAKYAVAISNGTAALHAAAFALDLNEGDEVITTPITFAATANAVLYMKAKPIFVDVDPITYNIDPSKIEAAITKRTKAIFIVHFTGLPCDMEPIHAIAKRYQLRVVEDAAHALGALYKSKPIGSISDLTTFSLHPVKHITTGEGGVITTNDADLYKRLLLFRSHGITRSPEDLERNEGSWYYEQQLLGYNYRMNDIQAALGLSQLTKIDQFVHRRVELAQQYDLLLKEVSEIIKPTWTKDCISSWHLYVIWMDFDQLGFSRQELFEYMKSKQIFLNVHYIPVYRHPYYQVNGYDAVSCINAEEAYRGFVTLPLYYDLSDDEQAYVVEVLKAFIEEHLKSK